MSHAAIYVQPSLSELSHVFAENWIVLQYFPNKDLKTFLSVRTMLCIVSSCRCHNHIMSCIDPQACTEVTDEVHDRCGYGNALPIREGTPSQSMQSVI